jgi:4-hydroxy-2-oxoheptanedioate aldolase
MVGNAGFDFIWLDLEHGAGDHDALVTQLQAAESTPAATVVRIAWNEAPRFKRVLDLGASGIMVPYVNTKEEAQLAASAMRYPPEGIRGVSRSNRAAGFGKNFDEYFARSNENLLTVVQIETAEAVANAGEIAAVAGVDVLFIGPLDLSTNLGIHQDYDAPAFSDALDKVSGACKQHGKAAGILVPKPEMLPDMIERGFTFFVVGSDGGLIANGLHSVWERCHGAK